MQAGNPLPHLILIAHNGASIINGKGLDLVRQWGVYQGYASMLADAVKNGLQAY